MLFTAEELEKLDMPEGDILLARFLVAQRYGDSPSSIIATLKGDDDEDDAVQNALKAIKLGKAIS